MQTHTPSLEEDDKGGLRKLLGLALGSVGIVYGDIGTSPLYAFREALKPIAHDGLERAEIIALTSLMIWSLTIIVTVKYVLLLLRADNGGEGGTLSLLALLMKKRAPHGTLLMILGLIGAALFLGDAMITPALSVLSAVEGLKLVYPTTEHYIVPIALAILIGLFIVQSRGTGAIAKLFGPITALWFIVMALGGIMHVSDDFEILSAFNPAHAITFMVDEGWLGIIVLGAVFLTVTGAEALYADLGHFGRLPIQLAWSVLVFPALALNYLGQGAMVLQHPEAGSDPFFLMFPEWSILPVVVLATIATVIASQAVISGAFSVSQQAVQLGFLPRLKILHTSAKAAGQIYVPLVNWGLLVMVILLVFGFRSSGNLAAAYGIAVTGTMLITACLLGVLTLTVWKWHPALAGAVTLGFLAIDGLYFASTATKIPDGGWFPLLVAVVVFTLLTTWATGRRLVRTRLHEDSIPFATFLKSVGERVRRVPGTSVFLASSADGVPPGLLHNLKHNHILHDRVVILTVANRGVPHVAQADRCEVEDLGQGFYRMVLHYGFMDEADIPAALALEDRAGGPFKAMETSYFLSRQTLIPSSRPGMALWREKLFALMVRNAQSAMEFFKLPTNRVIELGSQLEI